MLLGIEHGGDKLYEQTFGRNHLRSNHLKVKGEITVAKVLERGHESKALYMSNLGVK
jgi:hypothetical protein